MFAKNLKYLRKKFDMEQIELAHKLGRKSASSISEWEKGKYTPKLGVLSDIAQIFNVTINDLMEKDLSQNTAKPVQVSIKEVPVVSKVSAGMPIYAEEDIIEYTYIADTITKDGKEYFGLIVDGDSMDKEFRQGDIVIIERGSHIENGQIGVVQVNGYNATLKRVRYSSDSVLLMPESNNPDHEPQIYSREDEVHIIGRVVGLNRRY